MAKADFYILNASDSESRLNFLCRLVEKALNLGHAIYIHTNSDIHALEVDEYLWSFKRDSFVPHEILTTEATFQKTLSQETLIQEARNNANNITPVLIGYSADCRNCSDLLINLASELPDFYKQFNRIAEIVTQNETVLKELRSHYRKIEQDKIESKVHDYRKANK